VILYCYHKNDAQTRDHYELLRQSNPGADIDGMTSPTCELLEDGHWRHPSPDPKWCWHNWDWLLYDWYLTRGCYVHFDRLIVIQWDCLVFCELEALFRDMPADQAYICYPTKIAARPTGWVWVEGKHRPVYDEFCQRVQRDYGWTEPWSAFIPVIGLGRNVLERLARTPRCPGYCEYRMPTLVKAFGYEFWRPDLFQRQHVNFGTPGPTLGMVKKELAFGQDRVFHPYYDVWSQL